MCFYISNVNYTSDPSSPYFETFREHPGDPLVRVLVPVAFPTLAIAEAALRALLLDMEEAPELYPEYGEFPIILWNSHDPADNVVYDNLFNSEDPHISGIVDDLLTLVDPETNANRYRKRSLPEWDDIDDYAKLLATVAVESYNAEDDERDGYDDPTEMRTISTVSESTGLRVRGE